MLDEATIDHPNLKPLQYVHHLASYISDVSTIRARTKDMFGEAPPVDVIATIRAEHVQKARKPWNAFLDARFDNDPRVRPPLPKKVKRPEPVAPEPVVLEEAPQPEPVELPSVSVGKAVIASVARAYGLTPIDIVGKRRAGILVDARSIVAAVLRARNWSYPMIGRELDRDHSTIVNQMQRLPKRVGRDPFMRSVLEHHLERFKLRPMGGDQ